MPKDMVVKVIKVLGVIILCHILGVEMWPLLGGAISGGMNLLGGLFGQRSQSAINNQNMAAQGVMNANAIQMRVADARAAGINPLAALGSNFAPGAATAVGSDTLAQGMRGAGQDLSRAAQAYGDSLSKSVQLDNEYKQAQIDNIHATTAGEMLRNSKLATVAQAGTPPGLGVIDASGNLVKTNPYMFQSYNTGHGSMKLLSPDAQRSVFSGVPGAVTYPAIAAELLDPMIGSPRAPVRPDVGRWMMQHAYDPSLFGGGM